MDPVTTAALLANTVTSLLQAWAQFNQGQITSEQAMAYLVQAHADVAQGIAQFHQALAAKTSVPKLAPVRELGPP